LVGAWRGRANFRALKKILTLVFFFFYFYLGGKKSGFLKIFRGRAQLFGDMLIFKS